MYRPIVFNRHLNSKWSSKNNEIMVDKLRNIKPSVNMQCPESFNFYKTQFHKTAERNTKIRQYEIELGNRMLLKKIINLDKESLKREQQIKKPIPKVKKYMGETKKHEIIRVTQENQLLLKRLQERKSHYNVLAWVKDYEKSQYYKRNRCIFPSIDFYSKGQKPDEYSSHNSSFNFSNNNSTVSSLMNSQQRSLLSSKIHSNSTRTLKKKRNKLWNCLFDDNVNASDISGYSMKVSPQKTKYEELEKNECDNLKENVLYTTKIFLSDLGECELTFIVQTNRFILNIKAKLNPKKVYVITFSAKEEIKIIQEHYIQYDEMIIDLEYDKDKDLVVFNKRNKGKLNPKCSKEEIKQKDSKDREDNCHIYEENTEQHQENQDNEKNEAKQNNTKEEEENNNKK